MSRKRFPRPVAEQPPSTAARASALPQRSSLITVSLPPVGGRVTAAGSVSARRWRRKKALVRV